jgi:hypothetical protein
MTKTKAALFALYLAGAAAIGISIELSKAKAATIEAIPKENTYETFTAPIEILCFVAPAAEVEARAAKRLNTDFKAVMHVGDNVTNIPSVLLANQSTGVWVLLMGRKDDTTTCALSGGIAFTPDSSVR